MNEYGLLLTESPLDSIIDQDGWIWMDRRMDEVLWMNGWMAVELMNE